MKNWLVREFPLTHISSMHVTTIANQKGGVGKTTTSINLAVGLANAGKRVLLLDFDPQANTSSGLGVDVDDNVSAYDSLLEGTPLSTCIIKTRFENLDIVPANMDLSGIEIELAGKDDQILRLKSILQPLKDSQEYDYCIIDTPPSLGILMTSALTAADDVLIPLQCEWFGLEGLSKIIKIIFQIKESGSNPKLEIGGIIMTMYDGRTNLSKSVVAEVKEYFGEEMYDTLIPRSVRISESPSHGLTIYEHDKNGVGANAYLAVTKEFIKRNPS